MTYLFPRSSRPALVGAAFVALAALGPGACSESSGDTTGGKRIALKTKVSAGPEATAPFANARGWTINLTKATLSTGAFYYYEGAPIFSRSEPPKMTPRRVFAGLFGVRTAHAHPGHYVAGEARGQMTQSHSVDLRAGEGALPEGEGVTGVTRSATFSFSAPAVGPMAPELGAHVIVLEGTATKGAETRVFRAEIDPPDVLHDDQLIVEGCAFDEADIQADGTVTVNVKLPLWFDQVDFAELAPSPDGKPVLMEGATVARNQLVRGVKVGSAYAFSYSSP